MGCTSSLETQVTDREGIRERNQKLWGVESNIKKEMVGDDLKDIIDLAFRGWSH